MQNVENSFTFISGICIYVKPLGKKELAKVEFSFLGVEYSF